MADLVIRESDGWIEVPGADQALSGAGKRDLWGYASIGDVLGAQFILDTEVSRGLESAVGGDDISGIRVLAIPDDIRGEIMRVWVKREL